MANSWFGSRNEGLWYKGEFLMEGTLALTGGQILMGFSGALGVIGTLFWQLMKSKDQRHADTISNMNVHLDRESKTLAVLQALTEQVRGG